MDISFFEKVKIFLVAYYLEKAGVALREWLEGKIKILLPRAPQGKSPYFISITEDDKTEITEIEDENTEAEIPDKEALLKDMGAVYFNALQQKALDVIKKITSLKSAIAGIEQSIKENEEEQENLLESNPEYYSFKKQYQNNLSLFLFTAAGDIIGMLVLFLDLYQINLHKVSAEIKTHFILFVLAGILSVGFFLIMLKIAEQVYYSQKAKRAFWVGVLIFIAVIIGFLRGAQSAALGEIDISAFFLSLLFTILTFAFPLVAAFFYIKMKQAAEAISVVESKLRILKEQEERYVKKQGAADNNLQAAQGQFNAIVQEFVDHYQRPRIERERRKAEWERYTRYMEAYLNIMRLCYRFWQKLHSRGLTFKPLKRFAQIIGLILLVILLLLILGRTNARAEDAFNVMTICDRSSSADQYSCMPEALEKLGQNWIKRADDRGGGFFEVVIADRSFDSTQVFFTEEYPQSFAGPVSVHKKQYRERFLQRLKEAAERLPSNRGSAIIEAIYRASLRLRAGETWIYVLSDMRQINNAFSFERSPPSESEFMNWIQANGIKPVFKGPTRIFVCGMHPFSPLGTSPMTIQNYNRLLKLWRALFHYWGVEATMSEACDF